MPDDGAQQAEREREQLAARLREMREYLGMSQQEAAEAAGLSRAAISAIETGRRRVESIELRALASAYRQPVQYFLEPELDDEARLFQDPQVRHIARAAERLTNQDRSELLRFARFLRDYTPREQE